MVDHTEANKQAIPRTGSGSLKSGFWTEVLAKHGLESPGYQETLKYMREKYKREDE